MNDVRCWLTAAKPSPLESCRSGEAGPLEQLRLDNDRLRRELKRLSDFLDTSSEVVWETDDQLTITSGKEDLGLPAGQIGIKLAEALGINPLASKSWIEYLQALSNRKPFRGSKSAWTDVRGTSFGWRSTAIRHLRGVNSRVIEAPAGM